MTSDVKGVSLKELLVARDTELERLRVTVGPESSYVKLLEDHLEKQKISFEKNKIGYGDAAGKNRISTGCSAF